MHQQNRIQLDSGEKTLDMGMQMLALCYQIISEQQTSVGAQVQVTFTFTKALTASNDPIRVDFFMQDTVSLGDRVSERAFQITQDNEYLTTLRILS